MKFHQSIRPPQPRPDSIVLEVEQVTWHVALLWMANNKINPKEYRTKGQLLTAINEIRASFEIPLWEITEGANRIVRGQVPEGVTLKLRPPLASMGPEPPQYY